MNHLGSSTWIGDSDMNTRPVDLPPDYDDDPIAKRVRSALPDMWCRFCGKWLTENERALGYEECDFCAAGL